MSTHLDEKSSPDQIMSPSVGIHTLSSDDLIKHCHYEAFMSSTEPRTMKYALLDHGWIVAI